MTDPPSRPGRPEIVDYDKDYAAIHWSPSQHDGGSPILKYVIEKREVPDPSWHTVNVTLSPAEFPFVSLVALSNPVLVYQVHFRTSFGYLCRPFTSVRPTVVGVI